MTTSINAYLLKYNKYDGKWYEYVLFQTMVAMTILGLLKCRYHVSMGTPLFGTIILVFGKP